MDDISKVYIYLLNDTIIENLQDINNMSIVMLKGEKGDGAGTWGEIDGNIANQTDLQNALALKANQSALNTTNANVATNTTNIATLQAEVSAIGGGSPEVVSLVADMIDTTKTYIYVGTETGYTSGDWYYYDGSDWVSGGSYGADGGINTNARNLLKYVLDRVAYTEAGMDVYVEALYEALAQAGSGGGGTTTYTITNALVHVTNSNNATGADSGDSYSATLTADTDYRINSVTVTMGGVDVTSTVYSNGEINIASVTGDIMITASAAVYVITYLENYTGTGSAYANPIEIANIDWGNGDYIEINISGSQSGSSSTVKETALATSAANANGAVNNYSINVYFISSNKQIRIHKTSTTYETVTVSDYLHTIKLDKDGVWINGVLKVAKANATTITNVLANSTVYWSCTMGSTTTINWIKLYKG